MPAPELTLFLFLAYLAEVLGTVGGFGSSLFFVPVASWFMPFHEVLGLTALFHVVSNVTKVFVFRHGVDRRLLLQLGLPAVLCVIAGAVASKWIDGLWLEVILAAFLIGLSLVLLFMRGQAISPTPARAVTGGILSGGLAGLVGTGGAVRGLVLAAFALPKEIFIATSALIDLAIDSSRTVVYYFNGYIHLPAWKLLPWLLGVSIAGTFTGQYLLQFISEERFRRIVLALVLISGAATLVKLWVNT